MPAVLVDHVQRLATSSSATASNTACAARALLHKLGVEVSDVRAGDSGRSWIAGAVAGVALPALTSTWFDHFQGSFATLTPTQRAAVMARLVPHLNDASCPPDVQWRLLCAALLASEFPGPSRVCASVFSACLRSADAGIRGVGFQGLLQVRSL